MADIEKVIKGLECCIQGCGTYCPYFEEECCLNNFLQRDALELLKKLKEDNVRLDRENQKLIEQMAQYPQRETGHWDILTMCANEGTYCSVCHTKIFDFVHPPKKKLSQYCPHCGAKMDENYDPWED